MSMPKSKSTFKQILKMVTTNGLILAFTMHFDKSDQIYLTLQKGPTIY